MIKINLLPSTTTSKGGRRKAARKLSPFAQQMIMALFALAITGVGLFLWFGSLKITIASLKNEKADLEATIAKQEILLREVKNVEEEERQVKEKIEIIKQLQANQSGPVKLLDEISKLLPKGVGLTSLVERGGTINLEGNGFNNHEIVAFIDRLKASNLFSEVFLLVSEQAKLEGFDIYKFKVQFKLQLTPPPAGQPMTPAGQPMPPAPPRAPGGA